jgi:fructosamine-3-kinase
LHRTTAESFGWPEDNFIGSLSQANGWCKRWPLFWRERRLAPQVALASGSGLLRGQDRTALGRVVDRLDGALAVGTQEGPSLLHGDLWNGNVHALRDGTAAVVDPASYFGHREVDLAMAELFGGFDARFFDAYRAAWPVREGYELRRAIYQLYYLLVHVNLFGGSYLGGMRAAADAALAALD